MASSSIVTNDQGMLLFVVLPPKGLLTHEKLPFGRGVRSFRAVPLKICVTPFTVRDQRRAPGVESTQSGCVRLEMFLPPDSMNCCTVAHQVACESGGVLGANAVVADRKRVNI